MYRKNSTSNYNNFHSKMDLLLFTEKNLFVKDLKKYMGFNKSFIEIGSGTCQISLSMAIGTNNKIIALDSILNSLRLGEKFASKNNINNISFLNADLFDDPIKEKTFDFVWCTEILNHTENSKKGFEIISKWLKDDGTIIIGLYNKFGRFPTYLMKKIYNFLKIDKFARSIKKIVKPHLRKKFSDKFKLLWTTDQYGRFKEKTHTFDEVLKWFEESNITYLGSLPDYDLEGRYIGIENMNGNKGTYMNRIFSQLGMLFTPFSSECGKFIVIGKKVKID